jgi:hypothetical protein
MEDVSDWMKKLKLEKYADIFHEKQVDGYLLMQLDKQNFVIFVNMYFDVTIYLLNVTTFPISNFFHKKGI